MDNGRQKVIVDLSGEQKEVLGFATWTQVAISGTGLILGVIVFQLVRWFLKVVGAGVVASVTTGAIFFVIVLTPFIILAFIPVKDKNGNVLYYKIKQIQINRNFLKDEVGTYINIQPRYDVRSDISYWTRRRREE
ncbi:hypothetical protein FP435_00165 (plasmid) [Lactobacillus sp. PV037]|uniref:hypothetical protein n=1 Tax=Lactobacillus sp. PV037 TaxID=2594496 RepID=UPI0022407E3A|nr:hypothetical protein [Lactobacillus sp. PV037]QNQ82952.1 hypothetical protein FP435_00165 [Lactobacillus sp. PV037]